MIGSRESSHIASVRGHELRLVASMNARKATGTVYELTLLPRLEQLGEEVVPGEHESDMAVVASAGVSSGRITQ
jgi:hypothetical protein